MGYSRPRRQLVHENILKLLNAAKVIESDYDLWAAWLRCVADALYLEHKFLKEFREITGKSKKEILVNLDGLSDIGVHEWDRASILKWCSDTYDTSHNLRFSVETMDSIEVVRLYLEPLRNKVGVNRVVELDSKKESGWKVLTY